MAATGTPTPNIGLRIPIGTDPASVDDINYNSNLLDTKLGAVGSDSVQDQIDTLNSNIATLDNKVDNKVNVGIWSFTSSFRGGVSYNDITIKNIPINTGSGFIVGTSGGLLGFHTTDTLVSDSPNLTITNLGNDVYRFAFDSSWYRPVMLITSWDRR